jgi:hypothetical protein
MVVGAIHITSAEPVITAAGCPQLRQFVVSSYFDFSLTYPRYPSLTLYHQLNLLLSPLRGMQQFAYSLAELV